MGPLKLITIRLLAAAAVAAALSAPASGQGQGSAASCTASLITSFTPCLNFLMTNSTNGGGSAAPTQECCRSLGQLMSASTGCACLILTGNVPLGVPVNRTLAVALPKACKSDAVPLQCRDTSAQIPAPGPVAGALPPSVTTPATPEAEAAAPPVNQGQTTRPMVLPSSARRASTGTPTAAAFVLLVAVGAALV